MEDDSTLRTNRSCSQSIRAVLTSCPSDERCRLVIKADGPAKRLAPWRFTGFFVLTHVPDTRFGMGLRTEIRNSRHKKHETLIQSLAPQLLSLGIIHNIRRTSTQDDNNTSSPLTEEPSTFSQYFGICQPRSAPNNFIGFGVTQA